MKTVAIATAVIGLAALGLAACQSGPDAPDNPNGCYYVAFPDGPDAAPRFNLVAEDQPQIEYCYARLEEMRLRFLGLGGSNDDLTGYYNGQYIFITRRGVYAARSLKGTRFFSMARTGDGRLAVPGTIEQRPEPAAPTQ